MNRRSPRGHSIATRRFTGCRTYDREVAPTGERTSRRSPVNASDRLRAEHLRQVVRDRLLDLLVRAGLRVAIGPPAHELGGVAKTRALHVVVANLDDTLGTQRH